MVTTRAVSGPATVGGVSIETVNRVPVDAVAVPVAPLLKVTTLLACCVSKPVPKMKIEEASAAKASVLAVTVGTTVAT